MSWYDRVACLIVCLSVFACFPSSETVSAETRQLTHDGILKASPTVCLQTQEVIYAKLVDPKQYRLMRLQLPSGSSEPLRPTATSAEFEPACSDDGRYCAFIRQQGVLSLSMTILDRQTDSLAEIKPPPGFAGMRSPTIAPDNSRVLYSFADGGRQHIFATDLKASEPTQLTDSDGIDNWPHYSPNGNQIVFGSSRSGSFDIFTMAVDGSNVKQITNHPLQDIRPRFSPDSSRIAFVSHRDGNSEIYVVNNDGSNLIRVTNHPERDDYPTWHPNGQELIIVSERNGKYDLYLVGVENR